MTYKTIKSFEYASQLLQSLPSGILLTTKAEGIVDSMVIGWGEIGIEWGKPTFSVFVREGRYTRTLLDKNPSFTINAPIQGKLSPNLIKIFGFESRRNIDKIKESKVTLIPPLKVNVPAILEAPLTLECKVIYRRLQDKTLVPESVKPRYYPENVDSTAVGANRDYHVMYKAEIVTAYILEK